jgi:chitodextrinase
LRIGLPLSGADTVQERSGLKRGSHMTRALRSCPAAIRILVFTVVFASTSVSAQFRDRTAPTAPTNLVVTAKTETSVSLAWAPSTDNSGRFSYIICCAGPSVTVSQTATNHTLHGLQAGKTYTFRVYAKDTAGNLSKSSNAVTVTLPGQVAAPTQPVVQLLDVGPTHATLTWSSTDNGPTIWYTIYIDGQPVATLNSRTATFTCAAVLVATGCLPLNQDTTYAFTVRARDVDGNLSALSDPALVTTDPADPNDQTPPTQPQNVSAEDIGGHVLLTWDPSTDTVTPSRFLRYDVHVNGELRALVVGQTAAEVEVDFGVNQIEIVAIDAAGNASAPAATTVMR